MLNKKPLFLIVFSCFLFSDAQEVTKYNVLYNFTYIRDLENKENPYMQQTILSVGTTSSRYCSKEFYDSNDKELQRKMAEQQTNTIVSSATTPSVVGGPSVAINNSGVMINEEIIKNFQTQTLSFISRIAASNIMVEDKIPAINWQIETQTKTIQGYSCQKAIGNYSGRTYTAWFTSDLPYQNGPWKLQGLPGLILEAVDEKNEVSFICSKIEKNTTIENTTEAFYKTERSTKASLEAYNKLKKAYEMDPVAVLSAKYPNARIYIKNTQDATNKTIAKIKKYNPIEL